MTNLTGKQIGQYEIHEEIGHGGMATVYRATQPAIGREVAVKVLPTQFLQDRTFLERFTREVQVIAQLQHPRILPVHDYGEFDGIPYIVMAYMEGGTLTDRIRKGPVPLDEAVRLIAQIAEGLEHAHSKGIIHRDFKPSNVLLDEYSNAYLADFGIAKVSETTIQLTGTGMAVGTPAYMAPEMYDKGGVNASVDQYAMGVTLYQMLTGQLPFDADTPIQYMRAHLDKPVPDVRAIRPDIPAGVQTVIEKAMAKSSNWRYASTRAMAEELAAAAKGAEVQPLPGEAMRTEPVVPTPPPARLDAPTVDVPPSPPPAPAGVAPPQVTPQPPPAAYPVQPVQPVRRGPRTGLIVGGLVVAGLIAIGIGALAVLFLTGEIGGGGAVPNLPDLGERTSGRDEEPAQEEPGAEEAAPPYWDDPAGVVVIDPGETVRIGMALGQSPEWLARLGMDSVYGAQIAAEQRSWEVLGFPVEAIIADSLCNAEGGMTTAQQFVSDPGIVAVIGNNCSSACAPSSEIYSANGYSQISPSCTAPTLTGADTHQEFFLRTAHNDNTQGRVAAEYAINEIGVSRAATIHDGSPWSDQIQQVFAETFEELGGTITSQQAINVGDTDFRALLLDIAADDPQLLFYPIFLPEGGLITAQIADVWSDDPFYPIRMGADGMLTPDFVDAAGPENAEFMFLTGPDLDFGSDRYDQFLGDYENYAGTSPTAPFHAHAYDAMNMILDAIQDVGVVEGGTLYIGRQALRDRLFATRDFDGLTGNLTCNDLGDCADPRIAVNMIEGGNVFNPVYP
jgi:branched-chain amino acid transport system substrate-binding protein